MTALEGEGDHRRIRLNTAILLVVASMVGTGVFTTTGFLVRDVESMVAILIAWIVGGLLALCGALAYAELATALPQNGGEYLLLSRIYHPSIGFISGFVSLVVGSSAPMAASSIAFGMYLVRVFPGVSPTIAAIGLVVVMSLVHALRMAFGTRIQNGFTIAKIVLIGIFILAGLVAGNAGVVLEASAVPVGKALLSPGFAVGLIFVSFSYAGWNAAAYVAGEIQNPSRNIPRALFGGTAIVMALYLCLNVVFVSSAPLVELSGVVEIGHVAAVHLFGGGAGRAVSALIAMSLISTVGALVVTGPRIYEAMGRDYPRLSALAQRKTDGGPGVAIALQSVLAIGMILTASFDALLMYMGFTLSLFAGLTVAGVWVLRLREPELVRPYRTWGYPFTNVIFVGLTIWMMVHVVSQRPVEALVGAATLGVGGIVYLYVSRPGDEKIES